jgi:serine/threonine protein kinase
MEYVDGVNLRQAMQAGRFSSKEALIIVPSLCSALQYAHEQGVLHRDIEPENILLDAQGRVKLADFGIAKVMTGPASGRADITLTQSGARLGTPHYMAPEQIEKPSEVDHRADIYSLGVVFYELLTGELPLGRFAAPSEKTNLDSADRRHRPARPGQGTRAAPAIGR